MMRLDRPVFTFDHTFDLCVAGVTGNNQFRNKLIADKALLVPYGVQYELAALHSNLYLIQPFISERNTDPPVVGHLTKSDLEKLYTQYFVPAIKPARAIYDVIKNSANDRCPFCGGIGTPHNVDHFLPKTHFPQFSVLPLNLVPSCLDCNLVAKAHRFSSLAENQIIHPYSDCPHFFEEQWIFARYHPATDDDQWHFEFFVNPPENWGAIDKLRVMTHFVDFNIAERYGIQAADEFVGTIKQIEKLREFAIPAADIIEALLEPKIQQCSFINHWRRGMYQAIKNHLLEI